MVFAIVQQSTSHGLIKLIEYIKCMLARKAMFVELTKAFDIVDIKLIELVSWINWNINWKNT